LTNASVRNEFSKEAFLETYSRRIAQLSNQDFTRASIQARGLKRRWKKNYKEFFNQYNEFLVEADALGLTQREVTKKFTDSEIFKDNVSLFDSSGRRWRPDHYANMYSRTRSSEMETTITLDEMDELDLNLVKISSHNTTTPICRQYEGKYFANDQATADRTGIPLLTVTTPFHPNCLHIMLPKRQVKPSKMRRTNARRDAVANKRNSDLTTAQKNSIIKQEQYILKNRPVQ